MISLARKKILLACQDDSLRSGICSELEGRGYETYHAECGSNALKFTLYEIPDLLILDNSLKVIDSRKFVHIVRSNPKTKYIPIIGMSFEEDSIHPFWQGVVEYMRKPFNIDDLNSRISRIFEKQHDECVELNRTSQVNPQRKNSSKIVDLEFVEVMRADPIKRHVPNSDVARAEQERPIDKQDVKRMKEKPADMGEVISTLSNMLNRENKNRDELIKTPPANQLEKHIPKIFELEMEMEMIELFQTVELLLKSHKKKTIQFIGSRLGEGTSTIIREFAKVSASKFGKSVLLMDADYRQPSQHSYFQIKPEFGLEDVIKNGKSIDKALSKVENSRIYLSLISKNGNFVTRIFTSSMIYHFFEVLKERFDLILIDSPPVTSTMEGLAISSKVDGVILVHQAESTHWMITEKAKNEIVKSGGKILGLVFNKKHYHIPEFIYKRL